MKPVVTRLVVGATAAALALIVVELLIRVLMPQPLSGAWLEESGGGYDVNRPLTRARHIKGAHDVEYRLNELGFRGPSLGLSKRRVLVLGDSVTFGWLLDERETYVGKIAAAADREWGANSIELMNAAVGGWGSAEYLAFLEDRGASLPQHQAVLVFLSGDETRRARRSGLWRLENGALVRLPKARQGPAYRSLNRVPGYLFLIEHSHLASLARRIVLSRSTPAPEAQSGDTPMSETIAGGVALNKAIFRRLHALCVEQRVSLLVVATGLVNLHGRTATDNDEGAMNRQFMDGAAELFASLDTPFLDLTQELEHTYAAPDIYYVPDDFHPTAEGASLVADMTWPWLRERLRQVISSR